MQSTSVKKETTLKNKQQNLNRLVLLKKFGRKILKKDLNNLRKSKPQAVSK